MDKLELWYQRLWISDKDYELLQEMEKVKDPKYFFDKYCIIKKK